MLSPKRFSVRWSGVSSIGLGETGFHGAATIEQDIDPTISLAPIEDAKASLAYLKSVGF